MADYTPVTWGTNDTVTAAQLTEISSQIAEEETLNRVQYDKLDFLDLGVNTIPRWCANHNVAIAGGVSGRLGLTYFTSDRDMSAQNVMVRAGGTAAGATPTLVRFGLYSIASNGDLTLVASIPNDTTIFSTAGGSWNKAFSTPYPMTQGTRYAAGWLVVTSTTMPFIQGVAPSVGDAELAVEPRLTGWVTSLTDLPTTVANASIGINPSGQFYTRIY